MTDFDEIVDGDDLTPVEEARLRRVHELLLEAGPPPELSPRLRDPPTTRTGELIAFPLFPRRRAAPLAVIAAAAVLAAFAAGYFLGHGKAKPARFSAERVVLLHAPSPSSHALAVLKVAKPDSVGNWPMRIQVTGLPEQRAREAYYELWLTRGGRAVELCGTFRVHGHTTTIDMSVPYAFERRDGWIVTAQPRGGSSPGRTVLTT